MRTELENKVIILYDGECVLCNWGIQFLIKRDKHKRFVYISQRSPSAQRIFKNNNPPDTETIRLMYKGNFYVRSTAVLLALKELGGIWKIFVVFKIIPKIIRDYIYNLIARNRKKWFGTTNYCRLPDKVSEL